MYLLVGAHDTLTDVRNARLLVNIVELEDIGW